MLEPSPSSASSSRVRSRLRASYAKTSVVITSLPGASGLYSNSVTRPSPSTRTTHSATPPLSGRWGDHGHSRAGIEVMGDHVRVIQLVDMVCGEHEQHVRILVGNHLAVAVDRIRIPFVPAALGITEVGMQDPQPAARAVEIPGPSVGELLCQFVRLVLLNHPDVADATVEAIRQGEVDQPVSAGKGEGRLRAFVGQGAKAAAFSAREHERQNARSVHLKAA